MVYGSGNGCKMGTVLGTNPQIPTCMVLPPLSQPKPIVLVSGQDNEQPPEESSKILPERDGFDHIREYRQQTNSNAFSFVPSPPLLVKTVPCCSTRKPPSPRLSLPAKVTKIRSSGLVSEVHSLSDFPVSGMNNDPMDGISSRLSQSQSPCFEIDHGRHDPPVPREPTLHPELPTGLFLDPFAEYMLDRMARFRPLDGQSDPNAALDFAHPYQVNDEVNRQSLWTSWFTGKRLTGPPLQDPVPSGSPILENLSQNNGSSLFLPRNSPDVVTDEPVPAAMDNTPCAEDLEDLKVTEQENQESGTWTWCRC